MFSPIVAISRVSSSATEWRVPGNGAALSFSMSSPTERARPATFRDEVLELLVARDEIGLGIHLDHRGAIRGAGNADQTLGGGAAGLLGGGRKALLPQPVDRGFHVAVAFDQRLLAVHHAGAGLVAEVADQQGGNFGHGCSPVS